MARVTIEDCLKKVENRFELIHLATKRVHQLRKGEPPLVECDNKEVVVALREIAAGKVFVVKKDDQKENDPSAKEIPESPKALESTREEEKT